MNEIRFDSYYKYDEITSFIQQWAEKYPQLCQYESIGESYEGRDIWLVTITNQATGGHSDKPAFWVDGNIHATEVAPSSAALYLINMLLTGYEEDERIRYALDSRTFYIVPRVNPDGAEWALADKPKFIRSSTKPYPRDKQQPGLYEEDVDGDGRILQMRVKDPNGDWKKHPDEPRLMIKRGADEPPGGDFYRLLPEGVIEEYDGLTIPMAPSLYGLDLNRQFPLNWSLELVSSGDFPASEPEPRAVVTAVVARPNITGAITFHTFCGVHLRPLTTGPDSDLPLQDMRTYKKLGKVAEEMTGYPAISVFQDFAYNPKQPIGGTFDDWMYEHLGVYAWTTEIWSIRRQAGLKDYKYIEWFGEHPTEDDEVLLKWNDDVLEGKGFVPWYEVEHPQLGTVELGGWDVMTTWRNPPLALLEAEIGPLAEFALYQALVSPKLEIFKVEVTAQGGDIYRIRLGVENSGWLPTNVSEMALKAKATRALELSVEVGEGGELVSGKRVQEKGHLAGRDGLGAFGIWTSNPTTNRAVGEWVVKGAEGTEIVLTADQPRGGRVQATVILGEDSGE
ncbi:MAG TPA: M14 family metallopeptidase [Anaerolineae bacterium]|nr:M14 family metallopeptidase [Anaerolineae bacterium]